MDTAAATNLIPRRRAQKRKLNLEHPIKKVRKFKEANQKQHDYGPASTAPDMSPLDLKKAEEEFLNNLKILTSDRHAIERATVLQRDITAVAHGIEHERQALQQLEKQENINIMPCGLFIDRTYPFIGATPDGLVGDDMLVEIKCPLTAVKKGLTNAIQQNKIQILKYDKNTCTSTINKKSNCYYQIQGQLHVTERRFCLLGIWAGENEPLLTERIERDYNFWKTQMESKLVKFYMKCLIPEIVDSRHARGMPIRTLSLQDDKENLNFVDSPAMPSPAQSELQPGTSSTEINFDEF